MIHINQVIKALDVEGNHKVVAVTAKGESITYDVARGRYYHRGGTLNLTLVNGQIRKVYRSLIVEYNDVEVCL